MVRHPLPWIALGILAVFALLWDSSPRDLLSPKPDSELRFPNAYMLDVETREYNPDGSLSYHLQASRVEHHQQDPRTAGARDYTLIEQPLMAFFGDTPSDQPWQLSARRGRSEVQGTLITLDQAVRAWKETAGDQLLELTTERLVVKPGEQYAETDKAVNMRSPQGVTDAVGMRALMNQDRIELLSEVKGRYEP
jgi:lipopolysaccharide export system protein LptC